MTANSTLIPHPSSLIPPPKAAWSLVLAAAESTANVLLTGETGTGKGMMAEEIHRRSGRADKPFVKCNIASLPDTLIEAELFGAVRGAFTGAEAREGRFEAANGGTLFLDEIGEMPASLQAKLLAVLDGGDMVVHRVGETRGRTVDVRIIAATNRDLKARMESGQFRPDLFYRLNELPIHMPPLRERSEDVIALATHFAAISRQPSAISKNSGAESRKLTAESIVLLRQHSWPGNIRELESVISRAVLSAGDRKELLPSDFDLPNDSALSVQRSAFSVEIPQSRIVPLATFIETAKREHVARALQACNHNRTSAAKLLGVRPGTIRKYEG